ncbi:Zn-dependent exopeptidase [Schizopora paradoxa]|uniref:Peptide hydrolase n=1 Tax=Schizopora paradoxa TaxID=27342 RepID=A0A0H2SHW1_9AGAM|nr:Zn-dependent exopeptidase [Schizopora paradoxa]
MAVEEDLKIPHEEARRTIELGIDGMIKDIQLERTLGLYGQSGQQTVMSEREYEDRAPTLEEFPPMTFGLLYATETSYLFALRGFSAPLDHILPPSYKSYALSYALSHSNQLIPVPDESLARVRALLSSVKYDTTVARLVEDISLPQMQEDVRYLTGEREDSPIVSRHSFHPDTLKAAAWIKEQVESTGAKCELRKFLTGFAPNIICQYDGSEDTTALVLFSAHYDSRGSFGKTRAPGGDDDGSGTTAILSVARAIGRNNIKFRSNVQLVLFAGEEQGLYGSRAYSREMKYADANITLMVQADMLAYHVPGEAPQLGLPERIGTPEVAQLIANMSSLYSPELEVGFSPACCSDHQSFWENGFAASQLFERAGPIADPMYHNSGDLSEREGYDLHQLRSIAKVQLSTLLHAAGFDLPEEK